ncbi:hypothetical protein DIN87_000499 [Escherichia coli]|nr:hypothetical protein [Escherichia coli]
MTAINSPPLCRGGRIFTDFTMCNCFSKNLGLGEAAKRNVGTGAGQIPDMSSFASGGNTNAKYAKLPDGTIIQRGKSTVTKGGITVTLPVAMPNSNYVILGMDDDGTPGGGGVIAGTPLSTTTMHLHGVNWNDGTQNDGSPGWMGWVAISL